MADTIIDKAWSDLQPGDFIRWVTPRFVKYGRILEHKKGSSSLLVQFIEDAKPRGIPDAKWYHGEFKLKGEAAEEHLCVIDYSVWYNGGGRSAEASVTAIPVAEYAQDMWVTPAQVAEMLSWDEKQVRRYLRSGKIDGFKDKNDRWMVNRERLRDRAAKAGWV